MGNKVATLIKIPENPTTLAYLAGIIDGEGWVGITNTDITKRYSGSVTVSIGNTNIKLMDWLQDKLGGYVYHRGKPNAKSKAAFSWRVMGDNAIALLNAVRNNLLLKQEQADIVIAYHALRPAGGRGPQHGFTKEVIVVRSKLWARLKALNKKGDKSCHF